MPNIQHAAPRLLTRLPATSLPARLPLHRCGIPAANATYSSTVPPGGCILSCDDVRNRTALLMAFGDSVPFIAGEYNPKAAAGGGSRRLLQAGGSVWTNYSFYEVREESKEHWALALGTSRVYSPGGVSQPSSPRVLTFLPITVVHAGLPVLAAHMRLGL